MIEYQSASLFHSIAPQQLEHSHIITFYCYIDLDPEWVCQANP